MSVHPDKDPQPEDDSVVDPNRTESASLPESDAVPEGMDHGDDEGDGDHGRIPLGPPVFGRYALFITVAPMIFYLAGNMFFSYLESSRAHTCVKDQTGEVLAHLFGRPEKDETSLVPGLNPRLRREYRSDVDYQKVYAELHMAALESQLKSDDWTAEALERVIEPMMDENLKPDFLEKRDARREIAVLLKMKQLEEEHKVREVLALSYKHQNKLLSDGELDNEAIAMDTATSDKWFPEYITWYPTTYTIVIAGTALLMLIAFPGYFKAPFKISSLSVIVGVVGFVLWIGLIELDRNYVHFGEMLNAHRPAFNPFDELKSDPTWMWQFMAIRFMGLVIVVPFIEEFFLRGFLMRYIDDPDWDLIPLGLATQKAIIGVIGYGVLSHLGEPLAAAVWFGMVTWLFLRTKSIWDCVVAHAVTNLALGLFVCYSGKWYLW